MAIHYVRATAPPWPPDEGRTRATIAGYSVDYSGAPPTAQEVLAFLAGRRPRTLLAIRADLLALSASQRAAVWAAFTSGSPPLFATDAGPNAAAVYCLWVLGKSGSLPAADVNEARVGAVAMYAQDNPGWLVNPAFDPSISVPGDEPDV